MLCTVYTFKITMGFEFLSEGEFFIYFLCTWFFYERVVKHSYDSLKIEAVTRKKIADACEMNALSEMSSPHCAYLVLVFFQQPMNNLNVICLSPYKTLYFKMIEITFGFIILQLM